MPTVSKKGNVIKRCKCKLWKTCRDPWYFSYQHKGKRTRGNLDTMTGTHAPDYLSAKRAAVALIDGIVSGQPVAAPAVAVLTVGEMVVGYVASRAIETGTTRVDRWQAPRLCRECLPTDTGPRPFAEWPATAVTEATLQQYRQQRPFRAGNRDMVLLRSAFNWAIRRKYLTASPFGIFGVPTLAKPYEPSRTRRLYPGEFDRLMTAAAPGLRDLIIAGLETAIRIGELTKIQWEHVQWDAGLLFLPRDNVKQHSRARSVPMTPVLCTLLTRLQLDPAGEKFAPTAYVFGDGVGGRVVDHQRAWNTAVLRANGHTPVYTATNNLTAACRAQLKTINLHFHDLRREAASGWHEFGVPLGDIMRWLGHGALTTTTTYIGPAVNADVLAMQRYVERRKQG